MTPRLTVLMWRVDELYEAAHSTRDDWADWLYAHHVPVVTETAIDLAEKYNADTELAAAAGMLHDIAAATMSCLEAGHEEESMRVARRLLADSGFSDEEIATVVDDAIRFHSCRDGRVPQTHEGKVMAAADAIAHLKTSFYTYGVWVMQSKGKTTNDIRAWALPKLERDYHHKLFNNALREEVRTCFELLQRYFQSLK